MSTFTPTSRMLEPPDRPDQLAGAVISALGRPVYGSLLPWGPIKSFLLGAISLGVLPLLYWPRIFARFCIAQQQQFWHLLEWLRVRHGDAEAADLQRSLRAIVPPFTLRLAPVVCLIIIAASLFGWSINAPLHLGGWVLAPLGILGFPWSHAWRFSLNNFYMIWTVCLCVAYGSLWLHIREQAARVRHLVGRINVILRRHDVDPVTAADPGLGLRPMWICAAVIGVMAGAWWAIPAALAGALQKQYIRRTSLRTRSELSQRVRTLLLRQHPPVDLPVAARLRLTCRNSLCACPLPTAAQFCPRCGSRAIV
jgi:hypothetical protein